MRARNLDRLAVLVRDSLDLERIYSLIGLRARGMEGRAPF